MQDREQHLVDPAVDPARAEAGVPGADHQAALCAEQIRRDSPETVLRVVTHRDQAAAELRTRFPGAEVV